MPLLPKAEYAIIGGSSTFSIRFPEDLGEADVEVLERNLVYDTPYGESPAFKLFQLGQDPPKLVLTCKMHGRRQGVSWANASRQVFWVLRQSGVKRIISEGGVGSINHLLDPRDLIIPTDYIDFSMRRDVSLEGGYLLIMRQALCPDIRRILIESAKQEPGRRVFDRGVYLVTDGYHFESPAEIAGFRQWNADIVGQSLCPEVYLAREIGACYAGLYMVVNYAEGVVVDWDHGELRDIFYGEAKTIGRILLRALRSLGVDRECSCLDLRKPTLLRDELEHRLPEGVDR